MKTAFCFDLDGTLTKQEILPEIARELGLFEEIELLTSITMQGLITFDKSFKLRVKLLSTIPVSMVKDVIRGIRIDSELQKFIQSRPSDCYIVTGNLDVWISDFIKTHFGCAYFSSSAQIDGDTLIGVTHILDKGQAVHSLKSKYDRIVAVGDGMNDCPMFEQSDISVAYGGVHEPVQSLIKMSDYVCYDSGTLSGLLMNLGRRIQ